MEVTKYWLVHLEGTLCKYMHETRESAIIEAKRLAKLQPGNRFQILEVIVAKYPFQSL